MCTSNRKASLIFGSLSLAGHLLVLLGLTVMAIEKTAISQLLDKSEGLEDYITVGLCVLSILALLDIGLIFNASKEKTTSKRPNLNFSLHCKFVL